MNLNWIKNKIQNQIKKVFSEKLKEVLFPKNPNEQPDLPKTNTEVKKVHPWRLCPIGQHWVETHPYNLKFPNGNNYDKLIGGWTKFWNDILVPSNPLSPDLVKALIATESGFKHLPDTNSTDGAARGLIQITENTRKILQNPKGELRNHLIYMTVEESRETEINIGAGIRWLHHKKFLLEHLLKREATWEEAIAEYKGIYHQLGKDETADRIARDIKNFHQELYDQRNSKN